MKTIVTQGKNANISASVKLLEGFCIVLTMNFEMNSSERYLKGHVWLSLSFYALR